MKASARSIHLKHDTVMQVQDQCHPLTSQMPPLVKSNCTKGYSYKETLSETDSVPPGSAVTPISSLPMEVDSRESQKKHSPDGVFQATDSSLSIAAGRSLEDVYNWRKYGEKRVKGNESSRSYYKCSYPTCEAKKQVVRTHDGQTKNITYKGNHSHPKPQPDNEMTVDSKSNMHGQTYHTKQNGTPDLVLAKVGENEVAGTKLKITPLKVKDNDDLESRRCLKLNTGDAPENDQQSKRQVKVQGQREALAAGQSPSFKIETPTATSNEQAPSVNIPKSPNHVVASRTIVPVGVDSDVLQQRQVDSVVQPIASDLKGPLVATEKLPEDGYNWRKYGQKRISGSEFPRSYYRCTHPNCQVKKQMERSHDGKIAEIVYRGNHDHPKPHPSSRMVVGTILSVQEESDKISMNIDKDEHVMESCDMNPNGNHELSLVAASVDGRKIQDPCLHGIRKEVNDVDPEFKSSYEKSKIETNNVLEEPNHQQSKPILQIKDDLPGDVDSDEGQQRELIDNKLQLVESSPKGASSTVLPERSAGDLYNWRKYGQKHIKGNAFPRSYYRCTYPNCQVKKQLGLSHDGKIVEILYKGKHDHPTPMPRGVVPVQEERSDRFSPINNTRGSDDDMEAAGEQLNRVSNEAEGDDDPQSKRRKKDDDSDVAGVGISTREPRFVVEKPSEVDVIDDGYRWHKYGRKMVKGNPNPRNYYKCSNLGCWVKKHVERSSHNPTLLITTYEGKHNHDMPAPRTTNDAAALIIHSPSADSAPKVGSEENDATSLVHATEPGPIAVSEMTEEPQTLNHLSPTQNQVRIADIDSSNAIEITPISVDLCSMAYGDRLDRKLR